MNNKRLKETIEKNLVIGAKVKKCETQSFCEGCVKGKIHKKPFKPIGEIRTERKLQLVHSDVCGPMQNMSNGGNRYFVTFTDDYTRHCTVYFLRDKSEVFEKFKEFESLMTRESGLEIGTLRTDNGGEYLSNVFQHYLKSKGIRHETTVAYSPEQNGVAERLNRTLVESARAMIAHAGLSKSYWAEAVNTASYIRNRLPTSTVKDATPFEKWYGRKPKVDHMRVFGCIAYAHIPDCKRKKFDEKAEKLRFVGYSATQKGYRLYNEKTRKTVVRRDAIFNEDEFVFNHPKPESVDSSKVEVDIVPVGAAEQRPLELRRSVRERTAPVRYGIDEYADSTEEVHHVAYNVIQEPKSIQEALSSPQKENWRRALDEEMTSLCKKETWEYVELPEGRETIGCKWVFKVKCKSDGEIDRFKARLVAKGYAQQYGIDYEETFSPVVRFSSIRSLLAFAVQKNMYVHQMDVVTAFLNGELDEDIYMDQPEGYELAGNEHLVCKLKRSLYGLKQAPRCWNKVLTEFLESRGFRQSTADPCIYVKNDSSLVIIAIYVDDLILIAESVEELNNTKKSLEAQFEMKDMGNINFCLGVSIRQSEDRNEIWMHQKTYIKDMLVKYELHNAKVVSTPADLNVKLMKDDGVSKKVDPLKYQSMVGSLLYLAIATRPDIAYAVAIVSRFNSEPTEAHLTAVKRIFRYVKGTIDYALKYGKNENDLVGYSDADWAGDQESRRSTSGNLFILSNGAVSWLSKRQSTVSLSTTEAEYVSLSSAAQEAIWLRRLLAELGLNELEPTTIREDNQGAIAIAKNPVSHSRTKHIDIKYHFIRDVVINKTVVLEYCGTEDMLADILTKALCKERFELLRKGLGIVPD